MPACGRQRHTQTHAQTCTVCHYNGAVWHCRCTHAHTHAQPVLVVESEGTHWPNFPQLARLVGDQQSSPPVSPNRAYQSTHSLCVSVSLSSCALHLFECVYMLKCKISSKVCSCSSALGCGTALNKNTNAIHFFFLLQFVMSWSIRSETSSMHVKGFFCSKFVHKVGKNPTWLLQRCALDWSQ